MTTTPPWTPFAWAAWTASVCRPRVDHFNDDPPEELDLVDPFFVARFLAARFGVALEDVTRKPAEAPSWQDVRAWSHPVPDDACNARGECNGACRAYETRP